MDRSDSTDYFRDLYELGADPSIPLNERIERAVTIGRDRLGVPYGVLSYTGAGEYEIVGSTASEGAYAAGSVYDLETTWCRHVVVDREMVTISDSGKSEYQDDVALEAHGMQCYIGAAVLVDGETYGSLCYFGEEPHDAEFTENKERFVQLLARWIGHELEREKHYQMLDARNDRLTEFAGLLAHDLRTQLTSARGYAELASESVSEPEAGYLETALDSLDRMEALITETLSLVYEGGDVGAREPVGLGAVAETAWDAVDTPDATLVVEANRTVLADETGLRQLLDALFRNVSEHCEAGVTVTVRGTDDGFVVADDGPGLPAAVAASLFGETSDPSEIGLGLLTVERVVSGHGWEGSVDVADGTRFEFSGVGDVTQKPAIE